MRNEPMERAAEPDDHSRPAPEALANSGWIVIAVLAILIALIILPFLWILLRGLPYPD